MPGMRPGPFAAKVVSVDLHPKLALELNRADISDRRMTSGRIVERLDIVEHIR